MSLFIGDLAGYKYKQKDERIGWPFRQDCGIGCGNDVM